MKKLFAAAVATLLFAGAAQAANPPHLELVDSKNKIVPGQVVPLALYELGGSYLFMKMGGEPVLLGATKEGFFGNSEMYFAGTNCTGLRYLPEFLGGGPTVKSVAFSPFELMFNANAVVYQKKVFVPDMAAPASSPAIQSYAENGICYPISPCTPELRPAKQVGDLSTYVPPLKLRLVGDGVPLN